MSSQIPRLAVLAFVSAVAFLHAGSPGASSADAVRAADDGVVAAAVAQLPDGVIYASLVEPIHAGAALRAESSVVAAAEDLDGAEPARAPKSPDASPLLVVLAPPPPPPAPAGPPPDPSTFVVDESVWDALARCESGGNWAINTGNGYYGGLQFSYDTWHGYGGGEYAEYPHLATREQQIAVAERLHAARGFQPWPACRVKLGLP